jgi:hypothetical protein
MSGDNGPGPPPIDPSDECLKIYKGAKLASPKSKILSRLNIGDRLELVTRIYKDEYVLVAVSEGEDAGAILSQYATKISNCIQNGYRYIALITAIDGGDCSLEIRMESPV